VGIVLLAGVALGLSWQPYGVWPLMLLGIPAFTLAVRGVRLLNAFGLGYLFGLATLALAISWVHVLGAWVAVVLIIFMSLFFGMLGLATTLVGRLRWWPIATACCWVLIEYAYSRIPFGGFGWTRIAYAVVDTPLAGFFPIIGVAGVSFVVALVGQLIAWAVLALCWPRFGDAAPRGRLTRPTRVIIAAAAIVGIGLLGSALRLYQVEPAATSAGSVRVGIVQGNIPGRGIEAMGRARSVTNNHLSETIHLMTKVRLGQEPQPDFLLWPENSTDIDPTVDPITRQTVQAAAQVADRPILVGAVMQGPGPNERQTAALWWDPDRGVLARYDKQNLVPFGEWIPFRAQLLPLIPLLQQVGAQSVAGTRPGVLDVTAAGRPIKIGDVICFELAYDQTIYRSITGGAQVLMVQSNNATYGGTGQIEQQFAITRARAWRAAGNRRSHHEQRVGFHHSRWSRRDAHSGVHSTEHGRRDALAERPHAGHPSCPVVGTRLGAGGSMACLTVVVSGTWRFRAERAPASEPIKPRKRLPLSEPIPPTTTQNEMEGEAPIPASLGPILVIIPTYNESENIARIISRTREAVPGAHLLIADDNSPDGTGKLADEIAASDDHCPCHAPTRQGRPRRGIPGRFRMGAQRRL
jgi:apolipoprotein N-acyltransferase